MTGETRVLIDATPLIALGQIGKLDLLTCFDGRINVVPEVENEVKTEPANTHLDRWLNDSEKETFVRIREGYDSSWTYNEAKQILGESDVNGDVQIVTVILVDETENEFAVVSDDKNVRTVARSFGVAVTGTIGVIARAIEERDMTAEEGKDLVRRVDRNGLHMTGELREKAYELVEEVAEGE